MFSCFLRRYLIFEGIRWDMISKEICWTFFIKCYQTDHLSLRLEHIWGSRALAHDLLSVKMGHCYLLQKYSENSHAAHTWFWTFSKVKCKAIFYSPKIPETNFCYGVTGMCWAFWAFSNWQILKKNQSKKFNLLID